MSNLSNLSNPSNPQIDELALSDINMDVTSYYDLELSYNLSIQKVQELPEVQEIQIESMVEDTVDMQVD